MNPCRPWLGVVVDGYPNVGGWRNQVLAHEQRIGRRVDVVHQYHPPGANNTVLTADELYFVNRDTILYLNWRPITRWVDGVGGNATINAHIDQMANSIKAVAPRKIMLALHGEPERYVTPGTSNCPYLKGDYGSPAQYRAMWQNVRNRFDALGVDNVVWAVNYLGYHRWDCLFPELWPGNHLVDWILWDPYIGPSTTWDEYVGYMYNALETKSDATHAYTSKPWGIAEFGYWYGTDQAGAYRMYDDIKASLNAGRFPRLKLYEPYDTKNVNDTRISYTTNGVLDPVEQQHYNALANDPLLTDAGTPPPPPPPPVIDHFSGCDKSVESGLSCFSGTYSGIVQPTWQATDAHSGTHSVQVTNTTTTNGTHGLNAKPAPVGATTIGRTYTGGVWVRASHTGLPITLLLRERRPANGSAPANGYSAVSWTATDTQWHFMTGSYTAKEANNTLTYSVYVNGMPPGSWVRADEFSLTGT